MEAGVEVGGAEFRALFGRVASDPEWIRRVSHEITDAIHRDLPELEDDEQMRAATFASTVSVLTLMADMVRLGRPPSEATLPPDAAEYAREFVRRGASMDGLLRAYHVGHATFFRNWVAGVEADVTDPDLAARGIELGANWTFEYIHSLNRALVARYTSERQQWVRSADAVRTETVRAILAGDPIDADAAGPRLGYELGRHHLAFLVWSEGEEFGPEHFTDLERSAFELASGIGAEAPLVVLRGRGLVAGWVGTREPITVPRPGIDGDCRVAIGTPGVGVAGFRTSHEDAMHARRVARLAGRGPGTVTRFDDVALLAVASSDLDLARRFVASELGQLSADDDEAVRLAATLRAYLEENASPRRAGRRLGIHENTVKNRVRTAADRLGQAPEEHVAELLVALRLLRLTRNRRA
jgi:PucR C-terminal helix-turn-helix domain/GGDEF-like domain